MTLLRSALADAILYAARLVALPVDLAGQVEALKADVLPRDRREPEREAKTAADRRLKRIMARVFARQADKVRQYLEITTGRKQAPPDLTDWLDDNLGGEWDDEDMAELVMMLTEARQGGVRLFGKQVKLPIDWTLTNAEAATAARKYAYDLVRNIDKTTREAIRQAVVNFVETPGMTIGDAMAAMPFDEARALRVAVTEITRAYAAGQQAAGDALKEEFPDVEIVKRWYTNEDDRVCELCGPLAGEEVAVDDTFYAPDDDYSDGNPPRHVNCVLPGQFAVVPGGAIAGVQSLYVGRCIEILLSSGQRLAVTPNHKIATPDGWKSAKGLTPGDYVLCHGGDIIPELERVYPDNNHTPAAIEDIFSSLVKSSGMTSERMKATPKDLHGDGGGMNGYIHVVHPKRELSGAVKAARTQGFINIALGFIHGTLAKCLRCAYSLGLGVLAPLCGNVSGGNLGGSLAFGHSRPFDRLGFALASDVDAGRNQPAADSPAIDPKMLREFVFRYADFVQPQQIVDVNIFSYAGHVYDLQSEYELYSVNGIIAHNCRCWISTTTRLE